MSRLTQPEFMKPTLLTANDLNFSGGPGALPGCVLQQSTQAMLALPETGLSVLGMSHRSSWFRQLLDEAEQNIRQLLDVPERYAIVFLQGGSSLQFSMIPMNFAHRASTPVECVVSGYWSRKATDEAASVGPQRILWDGASAQYRDLPRLAELERDPASPLFHYVSNETVEGLQFHDRPTRTSSPVICDMSSDFLSRPLDVNDYGMIYAHAQKNLGPAGVTVALIDRELLPRIPPNLPPMLDYRTHIQHRSNYNTPPVFSIYVLTLVTRWLRDEIGGLEAMASINQRKCEAVYAALEQAGDLIDLHARPDVRSQMNIAFRFKDPDLNSLCLAEAEAAGFTGLGGHRSIGGLRASLYNAVSLPAAEALADFLNNFCRRHG
ncbi:phosphoserine transaminase [Frateuria aurantia]